LEPNKLEGKFTPGRNNTTTNQILSEQQMGEIGGSKKTMGTTVAFRLEHQSQGAQTGRLHLNTVPGAHRSSSIFSFLHPKKWFQRSGEEEYRANVQSLDRKLIVQLEKAGKFLWYKVKLNSTYHIRAK
jgi:hypothetical protein